MTGTDKNMFAKEWNEMCGTVQLTHGDALWD